MRHQRARWEGGPGAASVCRAAAAAARVLSTPAANLKQYDQGLVTNLRQFFSGVTLERYCVATPYYAPRVVPHTNDGTPLPVGSPLANEAPGGTAWRAMGETKIEMASLPAIVDSHAVAVKEN